MYTFFKQLSSQKEYQPSRGITTGQTQSHSAAHHRARKNINPVAGLQQKRAKLIADARTARKNINPVAGLQLFVATPLGISTGRPERISTQSRDYNWLATPIVVTVNGQARKNINPVAGLQRATSGGALWRRMPERISTQSRDYNTALPFTPTPTAPSQKEYQPSRGITTSTRLCTPIHRRARKNINPVAGLQQIDARLQPITITMPERISTQSRDYNLAARRRRRFCSHARKNINPVAGLQQAKLLNGPLDAPGQKEYQPSRGITTFQQIA